jgi:hypothetical protein
MSHLQHEDVPEKMNDTLAFWGELETGIHSVIISDFTLREIRRCFEPKQTNLLGYLGKIQHKVLAETDEVRALAEAYVENGVLTHKNIGDCLHMAFATVGGCDIIVSWNFKHMVRMSTIQRVRVVNAQKGYYKLIEIVSPTMMIGDDTDE